MIRPLPLLIGLLATVAMGNPLPRNGEYVDFGVKSHATLNRDATAPVPLSASPTFRNKRPVVIDPGHGGRDPGTHGRNEVDEKTVTLAVGRDLVPLLRKDRIRFILTRDRDRYVSLQHRAAVANQTHAALFVSLHCDEYSHHSMHGFTVIYAQGASADSRLAAGLIAAGLKHEHFFCHDVRAEVRHLYVLDNTTCPAVLVEMGFMSDPRDLKYLCSHGGQVRLAKGIARGIAAYLHATSRSK